MIDSIQRVKQEFYDLLSQDGTEIEVFELPENCSVANDAYIVKGLGYVVILASSENPGEWEFEESLESDLNSLCQNHQQKVYYVFLIVRQDGRGANGYIVSDFNDKPVKKPFEVLDGKYRVKEKRNFDSLRLLLSTDKIVNILLRNKS